MKELARRVLRWLRSPRVAVGVLVFLAAACALGAWAPWAKEASPPPGWATALGLERPFSSWPFLAGIALLFASTAACALPRWRRCLALTRGEVPASAQAFPPRAGEDLAAFLRANGFGGRGAVLFRWRVGFWGGWILHIGLLASILAVLVHQLFHDEGRFHLALAETVSLAHPDANVFGRERGPLAPESPPELDVELVAFDPFARQSGYALDRRSRLRLRSGGREAEVELDRAAGASFEGIEIFQSIPSGLALRLEWPDGAYAVLHLLETMHRRAELRVEDDAVGHGLLVLESERDAHDPAGAGRVSLRFESGGSVEEIEPGERIGPTGARLVRVERWGEFKYSRDRGLGAVMVGFLIALIGSALVALPAGVARIGGEDGGEGGRVFVPHGGERLLARWLACGSARPEQVVDSERSRAGGSGRCA